MINSNHVATMPNQRAQHTAILGSTNTVATPTQLQSSTWPSLLSRERLGWPMGSGHSAAESTRGARLQCSGAHA
jgi:hypothetical protein